MKERAARRRREKQRRQREKHRLLKPIDAVRSALPQLDDEGLARARFHLLDVVEFFGREEHGGPLVEAMRHRRAAVVRDEAPSIERAVFTHARA